ncbi:MAG: helix-turn-helix transcriptional regulator [Clostridia bacterium]|nr:helix-turn-helix transcriptional regulator [Clostridia bacterium]
MEFGERLQELRKQKELTQEELAGQLYVSRAAVSKWESGRGYPGIDSLKAIAKFFSVTIDDLLSGGEALTIAEEENKQKEKQLCSMVFALLDCSAAMLFFLPLFGWKADGVIRAASLLSLGGAAYMRAAYFTVVIALSAWGILMLALRRKWHGERVSLALNAAGELLLIAGSQPYAAALLFAFLAIKGFLLMKKG